MEHPGNMCNHEERRVADIHAPADPLLVRRLAARSYEGMARPDPDRTSRDPARDGVYRGIQVLLFLDVVLGLALAVVGAAVLEVDSIAYAGLGLAVIGLVLMVFFYALARRSGERR